MRADASPSEGFMKKLKLAVGKDKKGKRSSKPGKKKSMFGNMMKKKAESDDDGDEGM